jgi:outer membrane protein
MFSVALRYLVFILLVFPVVGMAEIKIGFVNMVELMEKSPHAEAARKGLEQEFNSRDKKLTTVRDEVLKLEETLKNDGPIMNDKNRSDLEKKILNRKREYNRQQDELREDFNIRRNEELGKLQKKVHEIIVVVAKAESYDLVVTQPVLYASERIDLTARVLQEMQKSQ